MPASKPKLFNTSNENMHIPNTAKQLPSLITRSNNSFQIQKPTPASGKLLTLSI